MIGFGVTETSLLDPTQCALILVDEQAGLAFASGSADRQTLRSNGVALARTAVAFDIPIIASTSASKVYSGPLMRAFREALPNVVPIGL
jgi:nicotinamidase-related amidase